MTDWRPSASIETLRKRAAFFTSIRNFFADCGVLEVDTPCLSANTITDVHLEAMVIANGADIDDEDVANACLSPLYLQTSPEYYMKRLLAAGSGDIYQLGKCFRHDELGRIHSPEFTMLEWYRVNFTMDDLINEVSALVQALIGLDTETATYQQLFEQQLGINPHEATTGSLLALSKTKGFGEYADKCLRDYGEHQGGIDALLQLLFSTCIEPDIGLEKPIIVSHFPASQAALAKLADDERSALRFELYFQGVELANGYEELINTEQLVQRFNEDNALRKRIGKVPKPIDNEFIAAMRSGLPACSGVALGVDRLFMLVERKHDIASVMPFQLG